MKILKRGRYICVKTSSFYYSSHVVHPHVYQESISSPLEFLMEARWSGSWRDCHFVDSGNFIHVRDVNIAMIHGFTELKKDTYYGFKIHSKRAFWKGWFLHFALSTNNKNGSATAFQMQTRTFYDWKGQKRSEFREISVSRVIPAGIGLIHGYFRDMTDFKKGHAPCFLLLKLWPFHLP